jgi:flagellar biosynthesis protein FlhF
MRMKSYFANSIQEAIDRARAELGSDAMLMSSSKTGPELKDLGAYEVVFGLAPAPDETATPVSAPAAELALPASALSEVPGVQILDEIASLRRELSGLGRALSRSASKSSGRLLSAELVHLVEQLVAAGFGDATAEDIVSAIAPKLETHRPKSVAMLRDQRDLFTRDLQQALVREEIENRFDTDCTLGASGDDGASAVLFVGPSGSGKTSSLVKLAFQQEAQRRRSVQIFSLDTIRVGATDQLQTYARILSAPFELLESFDLLPEALAGAAGRRLTLIDTPGFGPADETEMRSLVRAALESGAEVQLVLPATLSHAHAEKIYRRFAPFEPSRLLLTHTDEAAAGGALIEFAMQWGLPLSFLGCGQQIPEDLRPARKTELVETLFPTGHALPAAA